MVCADQQDKKGFPPIVWYSEYPGTSCSLGSVNVNDCQIEHPSRLCDESEQAEDVARGLPANACRRPNGFALVDIVGAGGGPVGVRGFAALPSDYTHGARRGIDRWGFGRFNPADWTRIERDGEVTFKRRVTLTNLRRLPRGAAPTVRRWNCDLRGCTLLGN